MIQRISKGDKNAYQHIVLEYQKMVTVLVYRMISNSADLEDICQDIFIKVYNHLEGFRFQSKLSTWIAKIAYTSTLNYIQKKRPDLMDNTLIESKLKENALEHNPSAILESKDTQNHLNQAIERLPIQYKMVLTLYHIEEKSYTEISNILNMPEGTVKNYLFRARKQLKSYLQTHYQRESL